MEITIIRIKEYNKPSNERFTSEVKFFGKISLKEIFEIYRTNEYVDIVEVIRDRENN